MAKIPKITKIFMIFFLRISAQTPRQVFSQGRRGEEGELAAYELTAALIGKRSRVPGMLPLLCMCVCYLFMREFCLLSAPSSKCSAQWGAVGGGRGDI